MCPQETVVELAKYIRDRVRPHLGAYRSRKVTGTASSGDATFAIDDIAEEAIIAFIEHNKLSIAYYSEDRGLIEFGGNPEGVLVIDPIDGTRPALAGFEQCVVSVAWARFTVNPTVGDVVCGCIAELKQDDLFFAERGKGAQWIGGDGVRRKPALMPVTEMAFAPISFEAVARPFEYLGVVLDEIVNTSSMKGGAFLLSSTAYSLTRLVSGQLAGVIDVGSRILRDYPATRERFLAIGAGRVVSLFTYDIAAAALIAREAGAIVTDAYGRTLDNVALLDSSEANLITICAASTPELHRHLIASIDAGSAELGRRLERI